MILTTFNNYVTWLFLQLRKKQVHLLKVEILCVQDKRQFWNLT